MLRRVVAVAINTYEALRNSKSKLSYDPSRTLIQIAILRLVEYSRSKEIKRLTGIPKKRLLKKKKR